MGFYIETGKVHGKAEDIIERFKGEEISKPTNYSDIPEGKALIVIVDNGPFEAAGFAFDEDEFKAFTYENDIRPRRYVLIDRADAIDATGFEE